MGEFRMTLEQRLMQALGELQFSNIVLVNQLEEAGEKIAELETSSGRNPATQTQGSEIEVTECP